MCVCGGEGGRGGREGGRGEGGEGGVDISTRDITIKGCIQLYVIVIIVLITDSHFPLSNLQMSQ